MNQSNADSGVPVLDQPTRAYMLPANGTYKDWDQRALRSFVPDARQSLVIEAVAAALAAGLYYTDEVFEFCAKYLEFTPEQAAVSAKSVQNGEVGMDLYYARDYLRARERIAKEDMHLAKLQPHVGQKLGTLTFNDLKRNTGAAVSAVSEDGRGITLVAKRGKQIVQIECDASQIACAMDRAASCGQRKTDFEATFKQASGSAQPAAQQQA